MRVSLAVLAAVFSIPARVAGGQDPLPAFRGEFLHQFDQAMAKVIALLRSSVEHVRRAVRGMPDGQLTRMTTLYGRRVPQWAVLLQLLAHLNDHLGQTIAYARTSGVVPPWSQ